MGSPENVGGFEELRVSLVGGTGSLEEGMARYIGWYRELLTGAGLLATAS